MPRQFLELVGIFWRIRIIPYYLRTVVDNSISNLIKNYYYVHITNVLRRETCPFGLIVFSAIFRCGVRAPPLATPFGLPIWPPPLASPLASPFGLPLASPFGLPFGLSLCSPLPPPLGLPFGLPLGLPLCEILDTPLTTAV